MPQASLVCTTQCLNPPLQSLKTCVLLHKVWQVGQDVKKSSLQVGMPHPILHFHLHYHSLGKQAGRLLKISVVGQGEKRAMTVCECWSGCSFLIDCGANKTVLSASAANKRHHASSVPLVASNGTLIKKWVQT